MAPKFVETAIDEAERLGESCGISDAGWVFDGNTDEATYRAVLEEIDNPGSYNDFGPPAPLSGEFADDWRPGRLYDEVGIEDVDAWIPEDLDEIAMAFEDAYYSAWWAEVERIARHQVG